MTFTILSLPPTVLHLVRLLLAFPPHRHILVTEIDWDAGTYRYIVS